MRKSWSIETLLFIAVGGATILIWEGGWTKSLIGAFFLFLSSYFLSSALKTATIREYINSVKEKQK